MLNTFYIQLTVRFEEQNDGRWTAECEELGTATFGHSLQEARDNIEDAICVHLNTLEEVGERDRFFEENDIVVSKKRESSVNINVPTDRRTFVHPQFYPVEYAEAC